MRLPIILTVLLLAGGISAFADSDSITLKGGYVRPTGDNDILDSTRRPGTTLDRNDLDGLTGEVGYEHFLGEHLSIGANVGYYNSDTRIDHLDFDVNEGSPVSRQVELRIVPVEFKLHFLPAGNDQAVNPYFGGGVGAYLWKYREQGFFVIDPTGPDPVIINGTATTDQTDFGWHLEGGLRFAISRSVSILTEAKYFQVEGDLRGDRSELEDLFNESSPHIDLSQVTFTGGIALSF